jgi:hypothetical protein
MRGKRVVEPALLDGEIWRPVVGLEELYSISNKGRLRRDGTGRGAIAGHILHPGKCRGYPAATLGRDGEHLPVRIHNLVLEAFSGPCPAGLECRHLNGKRTDNRWPENLEWGTRLQNARDRATHGTARGGRRPKLSDDEVFEIRRLMSVGAIGTDVAAHFQISHGMVYRIKNGFYWRKLLDLSLFAHPAVCIRGGAALV